MALKTRPFVVECLLIIAMASVLQTNLPIDLSHHIRQQFQIPPIQFWTLFNFITL